MVVRAVWVGSEADGLLEMRAALVWTVGGPGAGVAGGGGTVGGRSVAGPGTGGRAKSCSGDGRGSLGGGMWDSLSLCSVTVLRCSSRVLWLSVLVPWITLARMKVAE